jgi:8-oxo-dGTP pyrophosphatase MutT (NUDIX family)
LNDKILQPWKVRATRHLLRNRWISLREDSCVTARGVELDSYYVLEYPDWVHVAAFDDDDRLILVRQYRHGAGVVSLELPGGMMDAHESDPLVTGARELLEETGHVASDFRHIARLSPNPATHSNGIHILLATHARQTRALELDASEDIVVEHVPWRRALEMALEGEMINAQHVAFLFLALAEAKGVSFGAEPQSR